MGKLWLIWSNEHNGWWCANRRGYTHFRKDAGKYIYDQALEIVANANYGHEFRRSRGNSSREKDAPNECMVEDISDEQVLVRYHGKEATVHYEQPLPPSHPDSWIDKL